LNRKSFEIHILKFRKRKRLFEKEGKFLLEITGLHKSKLYCKKTFSDIAHFWIEIRSYLVRNEDVKISSLATPNNNFLTY